MRKVIKYRIYPTKKQATLLKQTLNECRRLYNYLLEQRNNAWKSEKKRISCFDQCNTFIKLKQERPSLQNVHSQVLQNVAVRLDLAFKAFFRRVKRGEEEPGYPRFHGKFRYDSFCYPQFGFKIIEDKNLVQLSKIGRVRIGGYRPLEGEIKTCTVRRAPTGKWFVTLSCEIADPKTKTTLNEKIGIDVGLESFATLSDGEKIENPRFFRKEEKELARAHRNLSKQKKGSPERARKRKVLARVYERIANKRHNFVHQESRKFVNRFDFVAIEDLSINEMQKDNFRCINKSIGDVAWGMFAQQLSYKAEWAGKKVVEVNPAYTSQTCSRCGYRQKLKLSTRIYKCPCCGLELGRDHNAAINILTLGLQSLPSGQKAVGFG